MFHTILVPLDGSTFAEHALPLAATLARTAGGTLRLLRVVPPLADEYFLTPLPSDPLHADLQQRHQQEAEASLESVVQRLQSAGPVTCELDVMEDEEGISECICADARETGADLIVLSSHGRDAVSRFFLGSIADELIRTAPVPVLLIRPTDPPPAADLSRAVRIKHLLVALDGDPAAELIVEPALALGKAMAAEYTLLCIVPPATPGLLQGEQALEQTERHRFDQAEAYLDAVATRLRDTGATVHTCVEFGSPPSTAILHQADRVGADLIALATHGRGAARLLLGSVADEVVRGSALPILVGRRQ